MNYALSFTADVQKVMKKWKKSNPALFAKLHKILLSIGDNPREGIGHPEPLKGGGDITWSRRITASDRIIYDIIDEETVVLVIALEGHYNDK